MIIKSITLENFRQYKGKQTIHFSTDRDKNVTVIKGDQGSGKTTLLESFKWCLYRELNLPNRDKLLTTSLINEMNLDDEKKVSVEIIMNHKNKNYIIRRDESYKKIRADEVVSLFRNFSINEKNEHGVLREVSDDEINYILPKDLSTYFFFDGERIENLSRSTTKGKRDLSTAVRNVLGLDVISNAIKHLGKVKIMMEDEYIKENTNNLTQIQEELNQLREQELDLSMEIDNKRNEIESIEQQVDEIGEEIKLNEHMKANHERREELEKRRDLTIEEIEVDINDIRTKNKHSFPEYIASKLIKICSEKLDLSSFESKGIAGIDGKAIQQLIEDKECICGQEIIEGSKYYQKLLEQMKYQPPASLGTIIVQFNEKTKDVKNRAEEFTEELDRKYNSYEKKLDFIEDAKSIIQELSEKIEDAVDVRDLERKRGNLLSERDAFKEWVAINEVEVKRLKSSIDKKEIELSEHAIQNDRNCEVALRISYTQDLEQKMQKFYNTKEANVRKELNKKVSEAFDRIIISNHKIEVNDDYTFRVVDVDGEESTSQGQDVITSFAFISGLIELAKKEHNHIDVAEPYPLIMDAPFATLSIAHRRNVARLLPEIAEQFILLTLDSQFEGEIEDSLGANIGKQYELNMHSRDEKNKYTEIM